MAVKIAGPSGVDPRRESVCHDPQRRLARISHWLICCEQQLEILRSILFDSSAPGYGQRDVVALLDSAEPPDFIDHGRYNTLRR